MISERAKAFNDEIDRRIRKLEQIRSIASDQEAITLLRELLGDDRSSGHTATDESVIHSVSTSVQLKPRRGGKPKRGDFLQAVREAIKRLGKTEFTGSDVESMMTQSGFKFKAEKSKIAVVGALRKLASPKFKEIKLVGEGKGRQPNWYSVAEKERSANA